MEDFWPLGPGDRVRLGDGRAGVWAEWVELEGAEALLHFRNGPLAGRPAVTRHVFGAGAATYVSTCPDPGLLRRLLEAVCEAAGVAPVLPGAPAGVEAVRRGDALFVLNHGSAPADVPLPAPGTSLLDGRAHEGLLQLEPLGADVLDGARSP